MAKLEEVLMREGIAQAEAPGWEAEDAIGTLCARSPKRDRVDIVTGAYALRNAPDLRRALEEVRRILAPGGVAAFLDFARPSAPALAALQHRLLSTLCGFWGLVLHGNPEIHGRYIAASLAPYAPMGHALALGVVGLVLSAAGAVAMWDMSPSWFLVALVLIALPCAWLGGVLHRGRHAER